MLKKIFIFAVIMLSASQLTFGQAEFSFGNSKQDIKSKILNQNSLGKTEFSITQTEKKPVISFLLSLILPGAGHLYAGRMDVGKYFLAGEAALWLTYGGLSYYGEALDKDARTYSVIHSGLNKEGKDDDYFVSVSSYNSIYDYNNEKLLRGEYDKIYDVSSQFWQWDDPSNRDNFDEQRKKSERMFNSRKIFTTGMIINRITSGISAFILTETPDSKVSFNTEVTSSPDNNNIDGFKINFSTRF
mgnify:CR=1 FL=1